MLSLPLRVKTRIWQKRLSVRMTSWTTTTKKSFTGYLFTLSENDQRSKYAGCPFLSGMSYNIERIGDNATNIAEAAIYLMEGKNAKHIHNN